MTHEMLMKYMIYTIYVIQKIWKSVNLGFSIYSFKMSKLDKNESF